MSDLSSEPVGEGDYVAGPSECIISIANTTGHFWEKLWGLGQNAEIRRVRKDPNVLFPGDRVYVPPIQVKYEDRPTEARHKFRRKGAPSVLRLRCMVLEEPLGQEPYRLEVDERILTGTTDGDGRIVQAIPPGAQRGRLVVGKAPNLYAFDLTLGGMNPLDTVSGIKARLNNMGFAAGDEDEREDERFAMALRRFQKRYQLNESGEPDAATRQKLKELGV